ncbi:BLUF domain-containing protein [bacterium]|nr:BLUF domain-containing protein [bacterium]
MLRKIIYTSRAAASLSDDDLFGILRSARRNNAAANVTGLLLLINGRFVQVLEGEGTAVEALYQKIVADTRHGDVQVLRDATIYSRRFADWAMGFEQVDDNALQAALRDLDDENGWHAVQNTNLVLNSAAAETLLRFYAPEIEGESGQIC